MPCMMYLSVTYYFLFITLFTSPTQSQQTPLSTDPSYYYNLCAPSTCGNLSLPYPFTLPDLCNPAAVEPLCPTNQSLLLTSALQTDTYRVLSINFTNPTTTSLVVASDSLFTCGEQISRPNYQSDASIFSLPFNYTAGTHFNCTAPIPSNSIPGLQNASCIGCEGQDPDNVCYYAPGFVDALSCQSYHVVTPGATFNASAVRNFRAFLQLGFDLNYVKPFNCRSCEASGGRCGTSPLNASFVCFCPASVHNSNCSDGTIVDISIWVNGGGGSDSGPSKAVIAAISASASLLLLVVVIALVVIFVRRKSQNIHLNKETISSISLTRYSYSQLKKFTNNFSSKLGEGGFGSVYKGTIHQKGQTVLIAVKMLKNSKQIEKQFMNEVATIGSVHHHNLVSMLGYCFDGKTCALVYEFVENGSLDKYIYSSMNRSGVQEKIETGDKKLTSKQVYSIALETARGILYLHEGCRLRILHCDIKPQNVLLDSNFSAKVADFGLARMIDKDHSHVSLTAAQGTPGYAAPEMWLKTFGPVTAKADVYSYGMLLLEMAGRRRNYDPEAADSTQVYFPEWLYNMIDKDGFSLVMKRVSANSSVEIVGNEENSNEDDEMAIQRMFLVGLWCIQYIPSNRPSMDRVIQMLEGHVEIGIPPYPFPENHAKHESTSQDSLV